MKKISCLFLLVLFVISPLLAQNQALTKEEKELVAAIDTFFAYFHKADTANIRALFHPKATLKSLKYKENKPEVSPEVSEDTLHGLLLALANLPKTTKIEERILGYKVQVDADLATVWTPYQFFINDKLSHCGANAFTLVKVADKWQIVAIIDTRRKEKC
jgi:hypothetical protein